MAKNSVLEEMRRLSGMAPRYLSEADLNSRKDHAGVTSKEYEGAPGTKKDGGEAGASTGNKEASVGGVKGGPGMNDKMTKPPAADKEGGVVDAGGGMKAAEVGGAKGGPGQNDKTAKADAADKEGGVVDDGGGAKTAQAGGAKASDAKKKGDGLKAEARELRNERMYELIAMLSEDEEIEESEEDSEENFQ
jgi:hypothetical protein